MSDETKWAAGTLECDICGCEFVAVYPTSAPRLECAGCSHMMPNPVYLSDE